MGADHTSRIARLLALIKSKVGPAAAGAGKMLQRAGQAVGPFAENFGTGLAQGIVGALPEPGDARFIARAAGQFHGASPLEAAVSGTLVRGPLAAREYRLAEDRAQMSAVLRLLGIQEREASTEASLLGTGREPTDLPTGKITLPLSKREIPVYRKPGLTEQLAAATQGAVQKEKAVAPLRTKEEIAKEQRTSATAAKARQENAAKEELARISGRVESNQKEFRALLNQGTYQSKIAAAQLGAKIVRDQAGAMKLSAESKFPYTQPRFIDTITDPAIRQLIIESVKGSKGQ